MNLRVNSVVIGLVVLAAPLVARAQDTVLMVPGERVRVTAPTVDLNAQVARYVGASEGKLRLEYGRAPDARLLVPVASLTRVEVRRPGTQHQAVKGLIIGTTVGGLLFYGLGRLATHCSATCRSDDAIPIHAWAVAIPGAGLGALVGAIVGRNSPKAEWKPVSLPLRLPPDSATR